MKAYRILKSLSSRKPNRGFETVYLLLANGKYAIGWSEGGHVAVGPTCQSLEELRQFYPKEG